MTDFLKQYARHFKTFAVRLVTAAIRHATPFRNENRLSYKWRQRMEDAGAFAPPSGEAKHKQPSILDRIRKRSYRAESQSSRNQQVAPSSSPVSTGSKWSELFASAKTTATPFDATRIVFEGGALVAYQGNEKKAELQFKQINSVFFLPSDDKKLDLFAFYPERPGVRIYTPKYIGTIDRASQLTGTETLLGSLGIKYTLPNL